MAAFDAEVGKVQDKPGITCCIRKQGNTQKMMGSCKKRHSNQLEWAHTEWPDKDNSSIK